MSWGGSAPARSLSPASARSSTASSALTAKGIDVGCENESWHADAHKIEGRFTTAGIVAAPIILAFAFRRLPEWRDTWIPTLATIPASIAAGVLFSGLGDGAATRATAAAWFVWLAFVAFQLLRKGERSTKAVTP
jgi:hypothetical protein